MSTNDRSQFLAQQKTTPLKTHFCKQCQPYFLFENYSKVRNKLALWNKHTQWKTEGFGSKINIFCLIWALFQQKFVIFQRLINILYEIRALALPHGKK